MIRRDHPAVRAMMDESDYPEHVQREFDAYYAETIQRDNEEQHYQIVKKLFELKDDSFPLGQVLVTIAIGGFIVAMMAWAWGS